MRGLAGSPRSTAPSNGMDAKRSAGEPLSSPAAAQRCAEGAGLDSGAPAAAQSAMPSIALPCGVPIAAHLPGCRNPWRVSTSVLNLHQLDGRDPRQARERALLVPPVSHLALLPDGPID